MPFSIPRPGPDVSKRANQCGGSALRIGAGRTIPSSALAAGVDFYNNQVDSQTGTIRLRAVFDNAARGLVPGMFARVRIPAGPPEQTLLVPDVAVQSDQGYKFVYVANADNKVETRSIETGAAHGPLRSVLKGLTVQDRVIVNGLLMLRPDLKVEVQTAAAKTPGPLARDGSSRP